MQKEDEKRQPQTFWLVYSYHSIESGLDAWDFRSRVILPGVTLIGDGEALPWQGSVLDDGVQVVTPSSRPPEVPIWLAKTIGKPRSRKAMHAAREQFEADLRVSNARAIAAEAQLRILEEEARNKAIEDRTRAEKVLADEMTKG
jgi:hypothetical protein